MPHDDTFISAGNVQSTSKSISVAPLSSDEDFDADTDLEDYHTDDDEEKSNRKIKAVTPRKKAGASALKRKPSDDGNMSCHNSGLWDSDLLDLSTDGDSTKRLCSVKPRRVVPQVSSHETEVLGKRFAKQTETEALGKRSAKQNETEVLGKRSAKQNEIGNFVADVLKRNLIERQSKGLPMPERFSSVDLPNSSFSYKKVKQNSSPCLISHNKVPGTPEFPQEPYSADTDPIFSSNPGLEINSKQTNPEEEKLSQASVGFDSHFLSNSQFAEKKFINNNLIESCAELHEKTTSCNNKKNYSKIESEKEILLHEKKFKSGTIIDEFFL